MLRVSPEELEQLEPEVRVRLALRARELRATQRDAFWNALQSFATAAIPIATFFGLWSVVGIKKKGG